MLFPASKIWPTAIWTSGSRGFRNAPCWAWAMASSQRFGSRAEDGAAEHRERLAGLLVGVAGLLGLRFRARRVSGREQGPGELGAGQVELGVDLEGLAELGLRLLGARGGEERFAARQVGEPAGRTRLHGLVGGGESGHAILDAGLGARQSGERAHARGRGLDRLLGVGQRVMAGAA